MSLINDALKKAQTNVDIGRMNPITTSVAGAPIRPKSNGSLMKMTVTGLLIGISAWGIALLLFSGGSEEDVSATMTSVADLEVAPLVDSIPVPEAQPIAEEAPTAVQPVAPVATQPVAPVVAEAASLAQPTTAAPVAEVVAPAVVSIPPEAVSSPAAEAPTAVAVAPQPVAKLGLKDEIVFALKLLEITAIMGDGNKARIQSDGQIHKAGELVNLDLKIRFQGKKGRILLFTDSFGEIYEKKI